MILRHSEVLGGISRLSFQMNAASLAQINIMRAIDAIGARLLPALHQEDIWGMSEKLGRSSSPRARTLTSEGEQGAIRAINPSAMRPLVP